MKLSRLSPLGGSSKAGAVDLDDESPRPSSSLAPLAPITGRRKAAPLPDSASASAINNIVSIPTASSSASSVNSKTAINNKPPSSSSQSSPPALIEPRRFALRFDPPQLVMEYKDGAKLRHRSWSMRSLVTSDNLHARAQTLALKLEKIVKPGSVSVEQIERLLHRLCKAQQDEEDDIAEAHRQLGEVQVGATPFAEDEPKQQQREEKKSSVLTQKLMGDDADFNTVEPEELTKVKEEMEKVFEKNVVRPGHPDYKYDIQEDFGEPEEEDNEWDEGDEYAEEDFEDDY